MWILFLPKRIQRTESSGLFVHIGGFQFWIKDARWLRIFYSEQESPPGVARMLEKVPVGRLLSGTDSRFCSPAASGLTPSPSLWPSPFEMNPCLSHIASWLGSNQAINTKEEFYWPIPSLLFYCLAFPLPSLEIDKSIFYKTCIQFSRLRFALSVKASYVAALSPLSLVVLSLGTPHQLPAVFLSLWNRRCQPLSGHFLCWPGGCQEAPSPLWPHGAQANPQALGRGIRWEVKSERRVENNQKEPTFPCKRKKQ